MNKRPDSFFSGRLPGAVMAAMYVVYTAYLIMR